MEITIYQKKTDPKFIAIFIVIKAKLEENRLLSTKCVGNLIDGANIPFFQVAYITFVIYIDGEIPKLKPPTIFAEQCFFFELCV